MPSPFILHPSSLLDPSDRPMLYSRCRTNVFYPTSAWPQRISHMLTVEEALSTILSRITALPSISTKLTDALGRVLAEEITADIDNPPFDNSAVDGYAVRAV